MSTDTLHLRVRAWKQRLAIEGYWIEHRDHSLADWRYEVANDDTRQSYRDWVVSEIEIKFDQEQLEK